MDRIDSLRAFVTVASEGSFTGAANKLKLSNQLVSKYVAQLEEHLSVRLLNRSTRKVHLTEAGTRCLQYANQILENFQDMEGHLGLLQDNAHGLLSINAPLSFSTLHLPKLISDFRLAYPEVGVDLQLNDRKVDILEEGYDLALRIGLLKSSSLIAKHIAPIKLVLCAAPKYLKQYGTPKHPKDLIPQHYLRYTYLEYETHADSALMNSLRTHAQSRHPGLVCNNGVVLLQSAIAGEGYVLQPTFIAGEAIRQGKLKVILNKFTPKPLGLYAVYPHRKLLASKLRVFIDFIENYYGNPPYWDNF